MFTQNEVDIESSVGLSRKWDAKEAGREVTESALKKLNKPPSFFLLFSTIHYKKHGGFQKLLDGVWEVLPEGTPLVGGTIACFVNNHGCFSRGVTALAVSYPNMDVAVGVGKFARRHPKRSALQCSEMIKKGLKNSNYKFKFFINMISAGKLPNLPLIGRVQMIRSRFVGWLATYFGMKLFPLIGYGLGKEEEVVDNLSSFLPEFFIIGGSTLDSGDMLDNYQFIDNCVFTNSIVALGCSTNLPIFLRSQINLSETDKLLEITSCTKDGRIIKKLNNKPAKGEILNALRINPDQWSDLGPFYYRTANYFPITFEENRDYTSGIGGFFGNNIYLGYKIRGKHLRILSMTGQDIIDLIEDSINNCGNADLPFAFMSSSFIFLNTLGANSYIIKEKLDEQLKEKPYLMVCPVNENAGRPGEQAVARVYSFNVLSFGLNDFGGNTPLTC